MTPACILPTSTHSSAVPFGVSSPTTSSSSFGARLANSAQTALQGTKFPVSSSKFQNPLLSRSASLIVRAKKKEVDANGTATTNDNARKQWSKVAANYISESEGQNGWHKMTNTVGVSSDKKKKTKEDKKHKAEGDSSLTEEMAPKAHYPDSQEAHAKASKGKKEKMSSKQYEKELDDAQIELVKLQEWIKNKGLKVVVIFEGRDAAGKGGIIRTITDPLNPRICSIHALGTPSDRERTQWYFQRYVAHLPAAGEMVVFDRSWYNRAGVERVMGFCSDEEYKEFLRSCPEFERMLVRAGIILLKYWISVSPEEQEKRFKERLQRPEKRWKLSSMDLYARAKWSDYSQAKDVMFSYTDIKQAPWFVVPADDKRAARLNCINHLLSMIPYEDLIVPNDVELPPLQVDNYIRPPISDQTFVPLQH